MKKWLVILFAFWIFPVALFSQDLSQSEVMGLLNDANLLFEAGNQQASVVQYLKVGEHTKQQRTEWERQVYVFSQTMAAMCYESLEQYENAFLLSESLLNGNITEQEKEEIAQLYVINGYYVAISFFQDQNGQCAEAKAILDKILPWADADMRQRIAVFVPFIWYCEGVQFEMKQQYQQAFSCMAEACRGFRVNGDVDNEIDALMEMGSIQEHQYDFKRALDSFKQAEVLAESVQNNFKMMSALIEEVKLCGQLDDDEYLQELNAKIDLLTDDSMDKMVLFEYYNSLGNNAVELGDYNLAKHWYLKNEPFVLQLDDADKGAAPHQYYSKLRHVCTKLKEYEEAVGYSLLEKRELQKSFGEDDWSYSVAYIHLADAYCGMGDSINCYKCLDTLFASSEKIKEPKELAVFYNSRARCLFAFKEYEKALADYEKADELLANQYDEEDGDRIVQLALLGGTEHKLGRYDESEHHYQCYADGIKKLKGENHPDYIDALYYLANAEAFSGHVEKACKDYMASAEMMKQRVRNKLPYLSANERESYWESVSGLFQKMVPFAIKADRCQSAFTQSCYDGLVLSKAFLLASEQSLIDLIKRYGTDDDLKDLSMIAGMQARIKGWERSGNDYSDSIASLNLRIGRIEKRLEGRCRVYGDRAAFMSVDYDTIKSKMKEDDVLVDYTDFVSESRGRVYAAYVINNSQEYPLLKELFEERMLDSIKMAYPDQYYDTLFPYAQQLYEMVWEPIEEYVPEGATVYYVPSQFLFQLALESLPAKDGKLLGEHYHFVRLSSARELVALGKREPLDLASGENNVVLYGGLQYSLDTNVMAVESKRYDVSHLLAYQRDLPQGDSLFKDLPGTKDEVDSIMKILKSYEVLAKPYMGREGTEESFVNLNGQAPKILHLATHGFYYTPDEALEIDYLRGYKDAMSLSGLVMSGGNAEWLGKDLPEGVLGGILTASDIARLDLSGVDLLVLSACNTGRGAATAEGLYGLQRAFKKAGVKTMVMSLWEVEDFIGPEFMTIFYTNLIKSRNEINMREAFEEAKKQLREKYPDTPSYWAVFVMLD